MSLRAIVGRTSLEVRFAGDAASNPLQLQAAPEITDCVRGGGPCRVQSTTVANRDKRKASEDAAVISIDVYESGQPSL
ncbi:MAG: hypothetical protein BGO03_19160 [Mesorhizobium sp. 61-13]|nr:MAG: hypothetical protein BGO03_19160 [Mesorhizobium sp. 61-13]